jgi:hypothetical protein
LKRAANPDACVIAGAARLAEQAHFDPPEPAIEAVRANASVLAFRSHFMANSKSNGE